jgi:hypothetical protein
VLPSDVDLYFRYLHAETCLACKLGKTSSPPQIEQDFQRSLRPGQKVIADIMTIKSDLLRRNFLELVVVDEFSAMVHVIHLESKSLKHVEEAFRDVIKDYKQNGWTVDEIEADGDGAFSELHTRIAESLDVVVTSTTMERHAVVAERMIRTLCELFRCSLAGLPYALAPHLYPALLKYVASSYNLMTNCHNSVKSPSEMNLGHYLFFFFFCIYYFK